MCVPIRLTMQFTYLRNGEIVYGGVGLQFVAVDIIVGCIVER